MRDTVHQVYSPKEVYRRFLWNAENVYGNQIQGGPPMAAWEQQKFMIRFTLLTLYSVFKEIGIKAHYRAHFWKYVRDLAQLRLNGRIHSLLEVLLRTAPNAHHLISWGETLVADQVETELMNT